MNTIVPRNIVNVQRTNRAVWARSAAYGALTERTSPTGCPVSTLAAELGLFSDDGHHEAPELVRMPCEKEPIFFSPQVGCWAVTRYGDIRTIFPECIAFSPSIALEKITPTIDEASAMLENCGYAMNRTLVNEGEPEHMPRRRPLIEPFTAEELKHHVHMARRLAWEYVNRPINVCQADLVDQVPREVTLPVVLQFLGVLEENVNALRKYSIADTLNTLGSPKPEEQVTGVHSVVDFWQFAAEVLAAMRRDPSSPGWMKIDIRMRASHPAIVTDSAGRPSRSPRRRPHSQ